MGLRNLGELVREVRNAGMAARPAAVAGIVIALASVFPMSTRADMVVIPQVGLNTTSVHGYEGPGAPESSWGYHLGCDFRLGSSALFMQTGIAWKHSGFKLESDSSALSGESTFNAWQVPVTVGAPLSEGESLDLLLTAGMVLDLIENTGDDQALDEGHLRNGTWAARIGLAVCASRYELDLVYDLGITDFMKSVYASDLKMNCTCLRFGVMF